MFTKTALTKIGLIAYLFMNICCNYTHSHKRYIYQEDFTNGSYIIKESGHYVLAEDIVFDPPAKVPMHLMRFNRAFRIGFFAAIVIQAENVTLDLNQYEIKQSMQHYLNQRFYAHIELGSSPFVPGAGPQNFAVTFTIAKNVIVENGVLGLSAHHGIHGNNCQNVTMRNLTIKNFEVGAISINGGQDMTMENLEVGPTSNIVAINGGYSAAVNILFYVETLSKGRELFDEDLFITINGDNIGIDTIQEELKDVVHKTQHHFYRQEYDKIPQIFRNDDLMPDGGAVYGLLVHSQKIAIGPFNENSEQNNISRNIKISNVRIQGLDLKVDERIALQIDGETKKFNYTKAQIDPIGSSFHVLQSMNEDGTYRYNPLANAQLIVSKYKKQIKEKEAELHRMHLYLTDTSRDSISQQTIEWASRIDAQIENKFVCNADQMLHSVKGSIPLRISGITNVLVEDLTIKNINNFSNFGSKLCGDYLHTTSFENTVPGYLGADIRGITVESCNDVHFKNVLIEDLRSSSGHVSGISVMFKSTNVDGDLKVNNLRTVDYKQLPSDFNQIPQSVPLAIGALVSQECEASLNVTINNFFRKDGDKQEKHGGHRNNGKPYKKRRANERVRNRQIQFDKHRAHRQNKQHSQKQLTDNFDTGSSSEFPYSKGFLDFAQSISSFQQLINNE